VLIGAQRDRTPRSGEQLNRGWMQAPSRNFTKGDGLFFLFHSAQRAQISCSASAGVSWLDEWTLVRAAAMLLMTVDTDRKTLDEDG